MENQRKETRRNLQAFTPVYILQPRSLLGYIEDLTTRGTLVVGERSMEPGGQVMLSIEFLGTLEGMVQPRVVAPARVAWCKQEKGPRYYSIGLEFLELKPEDEKIIRALLRRFKFRRELPKPKAE
jgi:hypothetical protein